MALWESVRSEAASVGISAHRTGLWESVRSEAASVGISAHRTGWPDG